jgi:hypothetical protein
MMRKNIAAIVVVVTALVASLSSCGAPPLTATFTSEVVQHETCKTSGSRPETCATNELVDDLRVRLVEVEDNAVWLYGIPRQGLPDRALLGTRDNQGGFLFVDEVTQSNSKSGCDVVTRLEISVAVDPAATKVGTDPCVALLGRETDTTTSTAGCDTVHTPPEASTRIDRRRWQKPESCTP